MRWRSTAAARRGLAVLAACLAACGPSHGASDPPGPPPLDTDATTLGTAVAQGVSCPPDAPAGARCSSVVVRCPRLDDLAVVVAATEPSATPSRATVVLHDYLGGTAFLDEGFVSAYHDAGFRVVQAKWTSDWQQSNVGVKHAACRYATLLEWIFENEHRSDRSLGFCAQSLGGGSGGLAFSLAHYGLGSVLDAITVSAGPPFARIDLACVPTSAPHVACPGGAPVPIAYSGGVLDIISKWEVAPSCGKGGASAPELARWAADSIVSPGAVLAYPNTSLAAFYCANGPDATVGQGALFFEQVTSDKTVHCVTGGSGGGLCNGEKPWPSALPDIVADMQARCIPRHGP